MSLRGKICRECQLIEGAVLSLFVLIVALTFGALAVPTTFAPAVVAAQSAESCFVLASESGECQKCNVSSVSGNSCSDEGFRVCAPSLEACQLENFSTSCFVRNGRNSDGALECMACPNGGMVQSQCVPFERRWCYRTVRECMELPLNEPAPNLSTTPLPTSSVSTTTVSVSTTVTTTVGTGNGCWAPENWSPKRRCLKCAAPSQGFCPEFTWTECYASQATCQAAVGGSGGDESSGGGTDVGGEASCKAECSDSSVEFPTPPAFRGPNCYDSKYGAEFGSSWKPSGKTAFEKVVQLQDLFTLLQTTDDAYPVLNGWGVRGCTAAAVIYRNIVCALELMERKQFEGTNGGSPGYFAEDIFNSGNKETDVLELAAFISHKMKETGRLSAWEEQTTAPYYDSGYPGNPQKSYHGRGPVQISWNYNYGPFSKWYFGDANVLLNDPDMVDPEGPMGFVAAFWFWATPRQFTSGAPISGFIRTRDAIVHWTDNKMNSLYGDGVDYDAVAGLGLSTNVINGGIECTGSRESGDYRVAYFLTIWARLGGKVPGELANPVACANDKFCNGLFSGCRATSSVVVCSSRSTECGPSYLLPGWQGHTCG